jgi:DNA replicative helicase MCM subunit Mcm2 (Cdc46/Mcm family)
LFEAFAKLRMAEVTSKEDAKKAVKLLLYSLEKFGFDEAKGIIDNDNIESGVGSSDAL